MRIENLSIRFVTVLIISMIGMVAIVLSLLAGSYFRQAALDSQMNSLSRVIEVASAETIKAMRVYTFDLGMRLGGSPDIIRSVNEYSAGRTHRLAALLDDPFINGFVGFSNVNMEKIRVYDLNFNLLAESNKGAQDLPRVMANELLRQVQQRHGVDRLKSVDVIWVSPAGPMNSTLVPVGGLRLAGYIEIVVNPAFNLPEIANITKTPVAVFSMSGERLNRDEQKIGEGVLPVEYVMHASDGQPAFRIVGYEDVARLNREMRTTQIIVTGGFLLLTLSTLFFALWLFNRFLFVPMRQLIRDMKHIAQGKLDSAVNKNGLRDFSVLAQAFESMAGQIRQRTSELERLLDLDDSAILCFGQDRAAVYMNSSAGKLFGYSADELNDLEMSDLFGDERVKALNLNQAGSSMQLRVQCHNKDGSRFDADAQITLLGTATGNAYAVVLKSVKDTVAPQPIAGGVQRMSAIEQSLSSLLEIARTNPGMIPGLADIGDRLGPVVGEQDKSDLRQQAVAVMSAALACWQHDLGKSKLALAEESRIWPVYIDKSTPTTRTLDKYLNLDSCPKNPRCQRVIDTAEFVLRKCRELDTPYRQKLEAVLESFRRLISGG
jgi:PAS domain S-box-containing protein